MLEYLGFFDVSAKNANKQQVLEFLIFVAEWIGRYIFLISFLCKSYLFACSNQEVFVSGSGEISNQRFYKNFETEILTRGKCLSNWNDVYLN